MLSRNPRRSSGFCRWFSFCVCKFKMHCLKYTETEDWTPPFLASACNHIYGYVLIQTIAHSFIVFFDTLRLLSIESTFLLLDIYRFLFAVGFSPYFDDITVTNLLSFHLTKAILALSSIIVSADHPSSFSIFFTGFNVAFSTLFNRTVLVAAISFSLKERNNWEHVKKLSVMI